MNMYKWIEDMIKMPEKKPMPILTFPCVQILNITVKDLISDSNYQALGIKMIADKVNMPAALSYMDLSVEAEAFGSKTVYSVDEVPTIIGSIVKTEADADNLRVPKVGEGRTGTNLEAIEKTLKLITDKPVFAGTIGPFSLAGRLLDVNEAMVLCYEEPEIVHKVLRKVTDFLIEYILAYKVRGVHGVVMAEPLAGILSPSLIQEFSTEYIKEIVDAVQDENFIIIYHNCGNEVIKLIDSILQTGCLVYHFGDAIDMAEMLPHIPANNLVMGNISPAKCFRNGTVKDVYDQTLKVLENCKQYSNFVISSGCDIPPLTEWDNIEAFFETIEHFYYKQRLLTLIA